MTKKITNYIHEKDEYGFSGASQVITISPGLSVYDNPGNVTTELLKGDFYISYNHGETALCIPGEDTIPVMIIILEGDYRKEFSEIISKNKFPLGECLRFFTHNQDKIKESSFIAGGFDCIKFKLKK